MTGNEILQVAPKSGGKADSLVVFLHGYGANGADLLPVAREWAGALPNTAFVLPNAPEPCEMAPVGFQWFSLRAVEVIATGAFEKEDFVTNATRYLNDVLDEQLKRWDVDESRLVVAGFSQGAMMAMYTMPRRAVPCAGVIGYSGLLVHAAGLKKPGIVKPPVLAIHGAEDEVVLPECLAAVQEGFESAGFDVETVMRPGLAHGIDSFGLIRGLDFVRDVLDTKEENQREFLGL